MRRREWLRVAGTVVVALAFGVMTQQLWWSTAMRHGASAAPLGQEAEVLGAVLDADRGPLDRAELEQRAAGAVLAVEVDACGGRRTASATVVEGPGGAARVVTNVHVVAGARSVALSDVPEGPRVGSAVVDGRWPGRDLAQLDVDGGDGLAARALPVGPDPQVGDPVVVVGHPSGRPSVEHGVVRSVELRSTDGVTSPAVVVTAPANGGHSGGAVVDPEGRLVAVVAARDPRTGHTVAHPVSALGSQRVDLPPRC